MEDTDNIQYILGVLIFSVKKVFHLNSNTQSSEKKHILNSSINQRHDKSILIIIIQCY